MTDCQPDEFGYITKHRWHYDRSTMSGVPYRQCRQCNRVEVYYLDDLEAERSAGV
jgi:hypothetical protein